MVLAAQLDGVITMKSRSRSRDANEGARRKRKRAQASQNNLIAIIALIAVLVVGGSIGLYFALKSPKKNQDTPPADPGNNTVVNNPGGKNKNQSDKNLGNKNPSGKKSNSDDPVVNKSSGNEKASARCVYDDALTKYLPSNTTRIEVVEFQELHANPWLEVSYHGVFERYFLGTWNHDKEGIGALRKAGVTEDSVKSMTFVALSEGGDNNLGFIRFTKAPDQMRIVQMLQGKAAQVQGKTYYQVAALDGTPLRHLYFLQPTLFVFAVDPKSIPLLTEERASLVVSANLIQAIKTTRGPLPVAAHRFTDGQVHFHRGLVNYFLFFTRVDEAIVVLHEKPKWVAYSRIPEADRMTVQIAAQFDDIASAQAAEKTARATAELLRDTPVQSIEILKESAAHMFKNVRCTRDGTLVTLSWPFTPLMVERFFGPAKNWR
jgi:hypothetical protein